MAEQTVDIGMMQYTFSMEQEMNRIMSQWLNSIPSVAYSTTAAPKVRDGIVYLKMSEDEFFAMRDAVELVKKQRDKARNKYYKAINSDAASLTKRGRKKEYSLEEFHFL